MMEGTIGEIRQFAGNFAPQGWAFCNGWLMSINNNAALYSLLGTMYGGDGRNNFALPDLRETDAHGNKHNGYELGHPSYIICIQGIYPSRS